MSSDARMTEEDGLYVGFDPDTEVASQGASREEAERNLAAAVEIHMEEGVVDVPPGDEDIGQPEVDWF